MNGICAAPSQKVHIRSVGACTSAGWLCCPTAQALIKPAPTPAPARVPRPATNRRRVTACIAKGASPLYLFVLSARNLTNDRRGWRGLHELPRAPSLPPPLRPLSPLP